jgi:hypothetical protein
MAGSHGNEVDMFNARLKVPGEEKDIVSAGVRAQGGDGGADPLISK